MKGTLLFLFYSIFFIFVSQFSYYILKLFYNNEYLIILTVPFIKLYIVEWILDCYYLVLWNNINFLGDGSHIVKIGIPLNLLSYLLYYIFGIIFDFGLYAYIIGKYIKIIIEGYLLVKKLIELIP